MRRVATMMIAVMLGAACGGSDGSAEADPTTPPVEFYDQIALLNEFHTAFSTGDTALATATLADDVVLKLPSGRSLVGIDEASEWLENEAGTYRIQAADYVVDDATIIFTAQLLGSLELPAEAVVEDGAIVSWQTDAIEDLPSQSS